MLVNAMMSQAEVLLDEETPVREAARLLAENRCDSAPVVDASGALTGIVTENDLLTDLFEADADAYARALEARAAPGVHRVNAAMARAVVTAAEDDDACELSRRMFETRIRCVPVLRSGRVVGLVRRRDIMRLMMRPDADVAADVRAELDQRLPDPGEVEVTVLDGVVEVVGAADPQARRGIEALARRIPGTRRVVFPQRAAPAPREHGGQQGHAPLRSGLHG
ncbi:CBS domain-containing protein [Nocardiopsis halophila]|uniref:CBS domain-containing protein n=1 Tax=Nocardiopsis halophila TaxID=141692 RepID=UPI00034641D1|nr:CBS domain-containing protein [Nocardiopsis halophila]